MTLKLTAVETSYGESHILRGVSLEVAEGRVLALLGRNGAGKSTTLKTIMGIVAPRAGSVRFRDVEIGGMAPNRVNRLGIAYVPEERRIFADLTVDEHLGIAARGRGWTPAAVFAIFPAARGVTPPAGPVSQRR